jgi:ABC-2 type transport system permease protein
VWVISDTLQPIILAALWVAVANTGTRDFTVDSIVSYYFMVAIVSRFTQDYSVQFVSNSIIEGDFSKYLIRPFNYLAEMFGISLAIRTLRLILLIPLLVIGYFFLRDYLDYDLSIQTLFLFFLSIIIGYIISFFLGNIFALLAFFVKQIVGLRALYVNVISILSGEYIPYAVLPVGLFFLLEILPFRYVLSFPIEIISGTLYMDQIRKGFLISMVWVVILYIVYKLVFKYSIKKYESEGI